MRWAAAPTRLHNSIFLNHNWSYLWLTVSGAGWNTPAAVWLGLSSLLNNELLVHISYRTDQDSQMCVLKYWHYCQARGENKPRVRLAETGWSPHLSWCLIQECACGRAVLSCVVLPCQTCRRSSRVLAAPVRLLLLALTCGSMWGFCRSTQRRRQEAVLLRSQLIGSALIVLWRRVGEAVWLLHPPTPPSFSCSIADFLPSFYYSGAKHTSQLTKQQLSGCVQPQPAMYACACANLWRN